MVSNLFILCCEMFAVFCLSVLFECFLKGCYFCCVHSLVC
jgi:hypothetical protein